jgi:tetratricopeptide (TPR) repeat protein
MKPSKSLKRGLTEVRREWRAGRYDRALDMVGRLLENWPDNPHLLLLRAELIQLQEENGPSLDEAKATLQRAVALDEQSPAALIELGHFLLAVEADAQAASKCFDKAIALCRRLLKEALLGQAETLAELERQPDALACLAEAYWLQSHNGKSTMGPNQKEILERLEALGQSN